MDALLASSIPFMPEVSRLLFYFRLGTPSKRQAQSHNHGYFLLLHGKQAVVVAWCTRKI